MLRADRTDTTESETTRSGALDQSAPEVRDNWSSWAYGLGLLLILGGIIAALAASDAASSFRYTGRARSVSPDLYVMLAIASASAGITLVIVGRLFRLLAMIEFNTRSR